MSFIDENGYPRDEKGLIHRQVAYEEIYLMNPEEYPFPFSEYVVHHIDGNKENYDVSNLQIMTEEEHTDLHEIPRVRIPLVRRPHVRRVETTHQVDVLGYVVAFIGLAILIIFILSFIF